MIICSRFFGTVEISSQRLVRFRQGLAGLFPHSDKEGAVFALHDDSSTAPIKWLIGVGEGEVDIPVVDPRDIDPSYAKVSFPIPSRVLKEIGAPSVRDVHVYAVLTLADDMGGVSMDLRHPILVGKKTQLGMQLSCPEFKDWPARSFLLPQVPDSDGVDAAITHVLEVGKDESIRIGDGLSIQVTVGTDGVVRLRIMAEAGTTLERGKHPALCAAQNRMAAKEADAMRAATIAALWENPIAAGVPPLGEEVDPKINTVRDENDREERLRMGIVGSHHALHHLSARDALA